MLYTNCEGYIGVLYPPCIPPKENPGAVAGATWSNAVGNREKRNAIERASYARSRALIGDGRTVAARRLKELAEALAQPWGGLDRLCEGALQVAWAAAALALRAEHLQAALRSREAVDSDELIRIADSLSRNVVRLQALQALPRGTRKPRSLADALGGEHG